MDYNCFANGHSNEAKRAGRARLFWPLSEQLMDYTVSPMAKVTKPKGLGGPLP